MNIDEKLDYYIARCDALDAAGIGELLKEIKAQRQAAQGGVTEAGYVFVCSNPACRAVHIRDPRGFCPACVAENGSGWSTTRQRLHRDGPERYSTEEEGEAFMDGWYDGQAALSAQHGQQGEEGAVAWQECYAAIIKALAAMATVHTPDNLHDLNAIPRDPIMEQVRRIKQALDTFNKAVALTRPAAQVRGEAVIDAKYDNVLVPFARLMAKELHANAGKGDRPGWLSMTPAIGMLEIHYHAAKLQKAVKDDNGEGIREYAADVANMAMMLLDLCGGLAVTDTAPPAQPAEVEATLRRILERGKHRTDGDLATLLDRVEHMTRGDQDLITMQRTEIRLLDERPAQPAERVPEGWRDEAERLYDAVKVFPENRGNPVLVGWDGFEGLLLLRNHVGKLLASPAPSPARGDGGEG